MWTWKQAAGELWHDGRLIVRGYSGHGNGVNNPELQAVRKVGPIPRGRYRIGAPYDSAKVGPYALPLSPCPGTDTLGRSAFRIHGDNRAMNRSASEGCIILARAVRLQIGKSGDHELEVIA